ncbi:hypothetical protein RFI_17536, partial [Reticulomyxa filosa]
FEEFQGRLEQLLKYQSLTESGHLQTARIRKSEIDEAKEDDEYSRQNSHSSEEQKEKEAKDDLSKLTSMDWVNFDTNFIDPSATDRVFAQFETKFAKRFLSQSLRQSVFELLPPEFRIQKSQTTILSDVKPGRDLYFYMFVIELLQVFYLLFLYNFMAEKAGSASFNTSRFNGEMVFWLFIQVLFLVGDRVAYLLRSIPGKLVLQIISVILYHWQIFIVWPRTKNEMFNRIPALVIFYLIKVTYWILSALQIRYGYPTFDRTHSRMAKEHGSWYSLFFTLYGSIPFVFEMRTILEWLCLPTTLTFADLLKVEEIFSTLFLAKCDILASKDSRSRGELVPLFPDKCIQGGCVFVAILLFLILPLLLFSTASPASQTNEVYQANINIKLVNVAGFGDINILSLSNFEFPSNVVLPDALRTSFSGRSQIYQNVTFQKDGDSIWTIPSPIRQNVGKMFLNTSLDETLSTQVVLYYSFTRQGPATDNPIQATQELASSLTGSEARKLGNVLVGTATAWTAPKPLAELFSNVETVSNITSNNGFYWTVSMSVPTDVGSPTSAQYQAPLSFLLVSDNFVSSSILSGLGVSSYSVVGFYVIVVYSFSQLLRLLYSDKMKEIIYTDLQNVDYLLRLVSTVKLARKQRNFYVEELLFRRLIRIYRDPALLISLTRRLSEQEQSSLGWDGYTDTSEDDPNQLGFLLKDRAPRFDKQNDAEDTQEKS